MSFSPKNYVDPAGEFPMPPEAEEFWSEDVELEPGERNVASADGRRWELLDMRGKHRAGKNGETVINVRARCLDDTYPYTGEVSYWLNPDHVDNPKNPQHNQAAVLSLLAVTAGVIDGDAFDGISTDEGLQLLASACQQKVGDVTFEAELRWTKRAYTGRDGQTYHRRDVAFEFIKRIKSA